MPYAWIIIVILWSVINAVNKAKKKQAQAQLQKGQEQSRQKTAEQYARQQAQRPAPVKPAPAPQPAAPAMSRQDDWDDEEENWDERDAQSLRPSVTPQAAPVKRHETKPLEAHMHTPVMGGGRGHRRYRLLPRIHAGSTRSAARRFPAHAGGNGSAARQSPSAGRNLQRGAGPQVPETLWTKARLNRPLTEQNKDSRVIRRGDFSFADACFHASAVV